MAVTTKNNRAFLPIRKAAEAVDVAQHVLRFWESKFDFFQPMKSPNGRRYYRPEDIETLCTIKRLLHEEGYSIRGVNRLLGGRKKAAEASGDIRDELRQVIAALRSLIDDMRGGQATQ